MKQLYYAISGTGMMITGAVLINIFRQVLDLQRIKTYGLVHELSLGGTYTFKPQQGTCTGFTEQIIQHEIQHFSGELI